MPFAPRHPVSAWLAAYPSWLARRHKLVLAVAAVVTVAGAALAATLPLHTAFSWLLPDDQPSVVALRKLTARKPSSAVVELGIASPDPEATRRFAVDLAAALRARVPPSLLAAVDDDDAELRRFVWQHRHLYASVADLRAARDALEKRVAQHNPLYVDLDDDAPAEAVPPALADKLEQARRDAGRAPGYVAEDGKLRMLVLRCPFGDTEPRKGEALLAAVEKVVADVGPARYHPQLEVGYAGDPVTAALEHALVLRDVVVSSLLCLALVVGVLLVVMRSGRAVFALSTALVAGCATTFGLTRLLVGHLNSSTAFLCSVVAGNGINFGIILVGRYLEERRAGARHASALERALGRTGTATGVAALAAGIAYASLATTTFRGFNELAIIAGTGMIVCWLASYTVVPALLTWLEARRPATFAPSVTRLHESNLAPRLVRLLAPALVVVATLGGLAAWGAARLGHDPFEDNLRALRSRSLPSSAPGRWSRRLDAAFGRERSGGFYMAVERADEVMPLVRAVRAVEKDVPAGKRVFGRIDALPLVLPGTPDEQRQKIALLGELRRLAADVRPSLDDGSREARLLDDLMPPADLRPLDARDLPASVRDAFTERDGRVGLLVAVHPGPGFDNWSARVLEHVVGLLRALPLDARVRRDVTLSGPEVIYVDMMNAVRHDGPRATALAVVLVVALLFVALRGRDLAVTLVALAVGVGAMLGLMALAGLKLNFLNFVAIPITVGIGVDYPFNVAVRLREERRARLASGGVDGRWARGLWQTGGAVLLCSSTTIIGYAVLLLSDTGAIRSFGAAAVLGEIACVTAALVAVPALLALLARRARRLARTPGVVVPIGVAGARSAAASSAGERDQAAVQSRA